MTIRFLIYLFTLTSLYSNAASISPHGKAVSVFTFQTKQALNDPRFSYDNELLKLALEKTIPEYGKYTLVPLHHKANYMRARSIARSGTVQNFIFKDSVSNELLEEFSYVPFPIDRGIVGYRVAFVSEKIKEQLKAVNSLRDLKKFSILQGLGWLDTKILRYHGFKVIEGASYLGLFRMIAYNRGDLFLRGTNEIHEEWKLNHHINNLTYDELFIIYYPLPRFFFTTKGNDEAIERIELGLSKAYKDGSLIELWEKHYKKSIEFVNFNKRKIFKLTNPLIDNLSPDYKQFIYDPKYENHQ